MIRCFLLCFAKTLKTVPFRAFGRKKRSPEFSPSMLTNEPRATPYTMLPQEYPYNEELRPLRPPEIRTRILSVLSKYDKVALSDTFDWKVAKIHIKKYREILNRVMDLIA